jgi:hypothetical protein
MQQQSYFKRYLELFHFLDWKEYLAVFLEIYRACYKIFLVQIIAEVVSTIENHDVV